MIKSWAYPTIFGCACSTTTNTTIWSLPNAKWKSSSASDANQPF